MWPSQYKFNRGSLFPYNLNRIAGEGDVVQGDVYKYVMGDVIGTGANGMVDNTGLVTGIMKIQALHTLNLQIQNMHLPQ